MNTTGSIQLRQMYSHYDRKNSSSKGFFRHCPRCATPLTLVEQGRLHRPTCAKCGFIQFKNPAPAIVVLMVENNQVLLGKRLADPGQGKWALPSGYIEYDEDFLSAGIREAKEETGLEVKINAILNVVSSFISPDYHFLTISLLAGVVGGELTCGDDLDPVIWHPLSQPLPEMAFEEDSDGIQHYQKTPALMLPIDPAFSIQNR